MWIDCYQSCWFASQSYFKITWWNLPCGAKIKARHLWSKQHWSHKLWCHLCMDAHSVIWSYFLRTQTLRYTQIENPYNLLLPGVSFQLQSESSSLLIHNSVFSILTLSIDSCLQQMLSLERTLGVIISPLFCNEGKSHDQLYKINSSICPLLESLSMEQGINTQNNWWRNNHSCNTSGFLFLYKALSWLFNI